MTNYCPEEDSSSQLKVLSGFHEMQTKRRIQTVRPN